jgi:hypothetical protein
MVEYYYYIYGRVLLFLHVVYSCGWVICVFLCKLCGLSRAVFYELFCLLDLEYFTAFTYYYVVCVVGCPWYGVSRSARLMKTNFIDLKTLRDGKH